MSKSGIISAVKNQIAAKWPPEEWVDFNSILAVSGGPDSVALLAALAMIRHERTGAGRIFVLHCNHQTRSSCREETQFVKNLAKQFGLPFVEAKRELKDTNQLPSEEVLRDFRYAAFQDNARQLGARYVVTGHQADDDIETILHRLFRGTGICGLSGIPFSRTESGISFIRPLIDLTRRQLIEFVEALEISYLTDESNSETKYTRNFLRHQIVPELDSRFGSSWRKSLFRLRDQAWEIEDYFDELASELLSPLGENRMAVATLKRQPVVVIRHVLKMAWQQLQLPEKEMTWKKWNQLAELVQSDEIGSLELPGWVTARKYFDQQFETLEFEKTQLHRRGSS